MNQKCILLSDSFYYSQILNSRLFAFPISEKVYARTWEDTVKDDMENQMYRPIVVILFILLTLAALIEIGIISFG